MGALEDRLFVICHVMSAIDGRISGSFFSAGAGAGYGPYREIWAEYDCDAILNGAVTCGEIYADGFVSALPKATDSYPREDSITNHGLDHFIIAVDPEGTLNWTANTAQRPGQPKAAIVHVLTENVSDDYLAFLREKGISYLFAGKEQLDLGLMLRKLKEKLGIGRILMTGGGVMDWSFLSEGYLDELSLVIAPAAGGDLNTATVFDRSPFSDGSAVGFTLKEVRPYGDAVHLRYTPKNVRR